MDTLEVMPTVNPHGAKTCYAMTCKRRMFARSHSCLPHLIVCTIYRAFRRFGYSYDRHLALMSFVYRDEDRRTEVSRG